MVGVCFCGLDLYGSQILVPYVVFGCALAYIVNVQVQQELEGERDQLQTELREAHTKISDLRVELRAALEAAENAASEAAARTADAVAAGNLAALAEAAAERSAAREAEAAASLHVSETAKQALQQELDRAHVLLAESKVKHPQACLSIPRTPCPQHCNLPGLFTYICTDGRFNAPCTSGYSSITRQHQRIPSH